MPDLWALVAAALAAVVTGAGTYLVARRTTSGTIATSDAKTLWDELRAEMVALRTENVAMRGEVACIHDDIATVQEAHRRCENQLAEVKRLLYRREGPTHDEG